MRKSLIIFLFGSLLLSCQKQEPKPTGNDTILVETSGAYSFADYVAQMPVVELPFEMSCWQDIKIPSTDFPDSVIKKYAPEGTHLIGKLFESGDYVAILYLNNHADSPLPVIVVNHKWWGYHMSTLQLFNQCGSEELEDIMEHLSIKKDMFITLTDSTIVYSEDADGNRSDEPDRVDITHKQFYINNEGKLVKK